MRPRKKVALDDNNDETPTAVHAPPKKDGARRNLRGKRGGLKNMPSMPLDVLMEVRAQRPRHTVQSIEQLLHDAIRYSAC